MNLGKLVWCYCIKVTLPSARAWDVKRKMQGWLFHPVLSEVTCGIFLQNVLGFRLGWDFYIKAFRALVEAIHISKQRLRKSWDFRLVHTGSRRRLWFTARDESVTATPLPLGKGEKTSSVTTLNLLLISQPRFCSSQFPMKSSFQAIHLSPPQARLAVLLGSQ